jgi:hypothetical protein
MIERMGLVTYLYLKGTNLPSLGTAPLHPTLGEVVFYESIKRKKIVHHHKTPLFFSVLGHEKKSLLSESHLVFRHDAQSKLR